MSDLPPPEGVGPDGLDDAPDMSAAELALGVLDGEERAAALRRVLADPDFAREVERWRGHLSPWFDQWPAITAPDILARIERSLDHAAPAASPVASLITPPRARGGMWPGIAALSSIAAAGLLVILVTRPLPPVAPPHPSASVAAPLSPTLVASITPVDKSTPVTAVYDASGGTIRLTEASLAIADRSAELWVIPADGTPHSLGVLSTHGGTALTLRPDNRRRLAAGAVLAVTLEPLGGSPTGLPTGPIVAKGILSRV